MTFPSCREYIPLNQWYVPKSMDTHLCSYVYSYIYNYINSITKVKKNRLNVKDWRAREDICSNIEKEKHWIANTKYRNTKQRASH